MEKTKPYLEYVRESVEAKTKKICKAVKASDIIRHIDDKHIIYPKGGAKGEPNILYNHSKAILTESKDYSINAKTLATYINKSHEIKSGTLALIAEIFDLPTEQEYEADPSFNKLKETSEDIVRKGLSESEKSYEWEASLYLLIEYLNLPEVSKVTICIDELKFVFKVIPTIVNFIKNRKGQVHLVYAPKHAYALLSSKEFIALWQLGVTITILPFRESLSDTNEMGFILNWLPSESVPDANKIRHDMQINWIKINTTPFIREHFTILISSETQSTNIEACLKRVKRKVEEAKKVLLPVKQKIQGIKIKSYKEWFTNLTITEPRAAQFRNCEFDFKKIPISEIYYRHSYFVRYKTFQSYQILKHHKGDIARSHLFQPFNLFANGKNIYYPTNPVILEWNPIGRWEIVEGTHRILAAYLHNPKVEIPAFLITKRGQENFNAKAEQNEESGISNEWNKAKFKLGNRYRLDIQVKRPNNTESATHIIDSSVYENLGNQLIANKFVLNKNEAFKYSNGKYPASKSQKPIKRK